MHPGNIFVGVADPKQPRYMAVDFGIIGTLSPRDQHYLAENFLAFFNRDYRKVAQLHVESGWVPAGTREDEFETAIRTVCEPIFNKPLKDISFAQLLLRLFQTARRFNMEVQPQLMLLQKTLFNIEGLGRDLYPELDLWQTAKPFLEEWTRERMSPAATLKRLLAGLPVIRELLLESPGRINAILRARAETAGKPDPRDVELVTLKAALNARNQHLYRAAAGAALLLGGILLLGMGDLSTWIAVALAVAGGGLLLWGRLNS
jgi:ubiquinone biosynthesis protein